MKVPKVAEQQKLNQTKQSTIRQRRRKQNRANRFNKSNLINIKLWKDVSIHNNHLVIII